MGVPARPPLVFDESILHIFMEKAICIPNLVFLKQLVFSFIDSPALMIAATPAVTFFGNREIKADNQCAYTHFCGVGKGTKKMHPNFIIYYYTLY